MSAGVVVGDLMLDVFSRGSASRLSPEAPVPVLVNPVDTAILGGAANTAANILGLQDGPVSIIGLLGDDAAGRTCQNLLRSLGIGDRCVVSRACPTVVKTRFLAGGHQIMRLDHERGDVEPEDLTAIQDAVLHEIEAGARSVVISDYQKAAISADVARATIRSAQAHGVPVVVDSKCPDMSRFAGAQVLTPNHGEATSATGHRDPSEAARVLAAATGAAIVVTLGADGMLVRDAHGREDRIASEVLEVTDVTGAGDTVTAAIAVALAEGADVLEAARWATRAAAVAVSRSGTHAVQRNEVDDAR